MNIINLKDSNIDLNKIQKISYDINNCLFTLKKETITSFQL